MGKLWLWAFAGLSLWLCFSRLVGYNQFTYDDAYIVLRYAANFIQHGTLSWNVGEHVEGFTSPLHLFLIVPFGWLGMDLLDAMHLVNLLCYAAFGLTCYIAFGRQMEKPLALIMALLAASYGNLIMWVWGGLEPAVTVMLLMLSIASMLPAMLRDEAPDRRAIVTSACLFSLAAFCRLDTSVFAAAAALAWLIKTPRKPGNFLLFSAIFAGFLALQTLWRYLNYGDVLPNTFYAKVVGSMAANAGNGISYIATALADSPWLLDAGIIAVIYGLFSSWRQVAIWLGVSLLLGAAYIIYVGGDFMPGARFMLPWLPFCITAIALAARDLYVRNTPAVFGAVFILLALNLIIPQSMRSLDVTAIAGLQVGDVVVSKDWKKGSLIALNAAGGLPYSNLDKNFIDMLGLNDRDIAKRPAPKLGLKWQGVVGHTKGDGAYVLRRKPDYIILSSAAGDYGPGTPVLASDAELQATEEFHRCYKHKTRIVPWPPAIAPRAPVSEAGPGVFKFSYYERVCAK